MVWDRRTANAEPQVLKGEQSWASGVSVSDDGRWIASGGPDGAVRVWDREHPDAEPVVWAEYRELRPRRPQ